MKKMLFLMLFCFCSVLVYSQAAAKLTDIISAEKATYGQTCYIAGAARGIISDELSFEEAFQALKAKGYIYSKTAQANDPITMKHIASILSNTWNVQESIMAITTHLPRYQFRQLQAYGVIPGMYTPDYPASGRDMLGVVSRCASEFAGAQE